MAKKLGANSTDSKLLSCVQYIYTQVYERYSSVIYIKVNISH